MFQEVRDFIAKQTNTEDIHPDTQLVNLGLDSMSLMMMVMDFEAEFGVSISDRQLENIFTVGDLVKLVEKP